MAGLKTFSLHGRLQCLDCNYEGLSWLPAIKASVLHDYQAMILSVPETEIYMVLTKILATLLWSRVSVLKGKDLHWCIYECSQAWLSIQGYWLSQTFLTPSLGLRGDMICSAKIHWRSSLQLHMHKPVLTFLEKVKRGLSWGFFLMLSSGF